MTSEKSCDTKDWSNSALNIYIMTSLPIQVVISEPVLNHNHNMTDGKEEGGDLQRLNQTVRNRKREK